MSLTKNNKKKYKFIKKTEKKKREDIISNEEIKNS
jgi:hypothetical protein